ncbi:MAG TPA: hypothetical protein VH575_33700 [Gemmataceae bacterium]
MPHDKPADIDPVAQDIIRRKAKKLKRLGGFSSSDSVDLEQDLTLHLLQRLPIFDPRRAGWPVFVITVLTTGGANLLRARFAAQRDFRRVGSLHQRVRADDGRAELGQTLCQQQQDARQGRYPRGEAEGVGLVLDVAEVLARLPHDQRELAEQLKHYSLAEVARRLQVPRSTLQTRVRQLREIFDHAGLRDYL